MSRRRLREIEAGDPVCVGARVAVRSRLRRVERWAGAAARTKGRDEKAVHQLRVSCRRASAALDAYAGCFEADRLRRVRRLVKRLRRGAGAARDLDVQAALWRRLRAETPTAAVGCRFMLARGKGARKAARRGLRRTLRAGGGSEITAHARRLLRRLREPAGDRGGCVGVFAVETVGAMVEDLLDSSSGTDAAGLHEARIAEKRAQYALELFRGVLDARAARALRRDLKVLHDGLGDFHDLVCADGLLERVALEPDAPGLALEVLRGEVTRRSLASSARARSLLDAFAASWGGGVEALRPA